MIVNRKIGGTIEGLVAMRIAKSELSLDEVSSTQISDNFFIFSLEQSHFYSSFFYFISYHSFSQLNSTYSNTLDFCHIFVADQSFK